MNTTPNSPSVDLFRSRPFRSWLAIAALCFYISACWIVYTLTVEPLYGSFHPYAIEADSSSYFTAAGVNQSGSGLESYADQVNLGGSVIGPALIATVFRNRFGVAVFDCALFAVTIYTAGAVRGLRRRTFVLLMIANALTLPTLMTLNKEILALAGIVFFAKYLYSEKRQFWILAVCLALSTLARWQQTAFLLVFLALQSRLLPFRGRPKFGIAALVVFLSAAWAFIAWKFSSLLTAYLALQAEITTGTVSRLNAIQAKGGFFLVVWPKIVMNISGRLLQVSYFLTEWIHQDFHDLQNTVIGNLHSAAFLVLLAAMLLKRRFRLGRPLVLLSVVYLVLTAVSPLIQNRYEYPAYALLAMEMSRREESLEPVKDLKHLPPLPQSYLVVR